MKLYKSQRLDISNLISLRGKFYRHDFYTEVFQKKNDIIDFIDDSGKFLITIIHSFNNNLEEPEYDIEVMFKSNGGNVPNCTQKIDRLILEDSVCAELIGEPEKIPEAIKSLNELALSMKLAIGRNVWVQYIKDDVPYVYLYAEKK